MTTQLLEINQISQLSHDSQGIIDEGRGTFETSCMVHAVLLPVGVRVSSKCGPSVPTALLVCV